MADLADVFREIERMRAEGVVEECAIGGATAVLFYAEPTRTYDVDVFVLLPPGAPPLAPLGKMYEWAAARGFAPGAEHVMIHGVPVQFLPAHNRLAEEAIREARTLDYEGASVRVIAPEHLVALALQAGGARRRERAWQLLGSGQVDRERVRSILADHGIDVIIPEDV